MLSLMNMIDVYREGKGLKGKVYRLADFVSNFTGFQFQKEKFKQICGSYQCSGLWIYPIFLTLILAFASYILQFGSWILDLNPLLLFFGFHHSQDHVMPTCVVA